MAVQRTHGIPLISAEVARAFAALVMRDALSPAGEAAQSLVISDGGDVWILRGERGRAVHIDKFDAQIVLFDVPVT